MLVKAVGPRMYAGEPVATLLIDRFRLSPLGFGLLAFTLSFIVPLILTAITGEAFPARGDGLVTFLESPTTYLYRFLMIPLAGMLMVLIYRRVEGMFRHMRRLGVITCSEDVWTAYVSRMERRFGSIWILIASLIIAVAVTLEIVRQGGSPGEHLDQAVWSDLWGVAGIYNTFLLDLGMYYFSAQLLLRATLLLHLLHRLFDEPDLEIQIDVRHPDGSGGLRPLRRLAGPIHFFVLLVGLGGPINLGLKMAAISDPVAPVLLLCYLLLGSFAFFSPLVAGREALISAWESFADRTRGEGGSDGGQPAAHLLSRHWENILAEPFRLRTLLRYALCVLLPLALVFVIEMLKHTGQL